MDEVAEAIALLRRYPAALIADACDGRGVVPSFVQPIVAGATVAGRAYTVRSQPGDNLAIHIAISSAEPGSVIVAEAGEEEYALWGEVASIAAVEARLAAFVTDGFVRDRAEMARTGISVFARGVSIRKAKKQDPGTHDVKIVWGATTVRPGDIVVGDVDGLVIVPPDRLETVVGKLERMAQGEQDVLRGLKQGKSTLQLLGLPNREVQP